MQLLKKSQKSLLTTLQKKENNYEISIYNDDLTADCVVKNTAKIKIAFPSLSAEFYDLFQNRIKEKGFTNKRLTAAINNVIDTCIYPNPTIASILKYDKRAELFTWQQIMKLNDTIKDPFQYFTSIDIGIKKPMYIRTEYFEKYEFIKWTPKKIKLL